MIGAMTTMPKRRGSCRSSRSSFHIRADARISCSTAAAAASTPGVSTTAAKIVSAASCGQNDRNAGAFEHDRPQRDEEVARRHDVGDPRGRAPACSRSER